MITKVLNLVAAIKPRFKHNFKGTFKNGTSLLCQKFS